MTPSRDHTELVIELWEACRSRRPKINLSQLGNGDSALGIDEVSDASRIFLDCVARGESKGHSILLWIDAVQEYATIVSKHWGRGNIPADGGDLERIAYKVIRKYEEK